MVRANLEIGIKKALAAMGAADVLFALDYPPPQTGADYATNAALAAAKVIGKNEREVAEELRQALEDAQIPNVQKIEVAGAGFLNFYLDPSYFDDVVAGARDEQWGSNSHRADQKIMVEYAQPNPFKQFHAGHLMGTAIGESIARLLEISGSSVLRANYQGDVGVHVAKALWAMMLKSFDPKDIVQLGEAYTLGANAYEDDPAAKAEIDELNRKIYERDPLVYPLYLEGRDTSLRHFEALYAILGAKFDHYFFESETGPIGREIVLAHPEIFPESDGARVFKGEAHGLHTRVFINAKGLPTYEAKELGLEKLKKDLYPDTTLLVIETANEITEYFRVIKKALEQIYPEIAAQLVHISHGFMRLTAGKMSSRKGNIITGESLLRDMTEAAREKMASREMDGVAREKVARAVAVAAIKYSILKQSSGKDIVFDPDQSLSLEGDSGPYLQYAHARCVSILRKASAEGVEPAAERKGGSLALEGVSLPLARLVSRFPEIVVRAARELEPHHVAQYLTELAGEFNSFYAKEKVLDGTGAASGKLALVDAVRQTLRNGLWILGIESPEEM